MIKVKALRDFGSEDYGYLSTGDVVRMTDDDAANLRSHGYVDFFEVEEHEEIAEMAEIKEAIAVVAKPHKTPRKTTL